MQNTASNLSTLLQEGTHMNVVSDTKNIVVVFDGHHANAECCDIIHKFKNEEGKWAFKWTKKENGNKQEFLSEFLYDDILSIKNNRLVFSKNGEIGFWYFNTRTEFIYP